MEAIYRLIATLLMAIVPALLFVGLWKGLRRLRAAPLVDRAASRAGVDDPSVSVQDAANAVFSPNESIFGESSNRTKRAAGCCPYCNTSNDSSYRFCGNCGSKL